ncbi:MAG: DNA double-strand break repair nuclease NurA [Methanotrichaceae archaeon]
MLEEKRRLAIIAELIRDHISISDIDQYCTETGVLKDDFIEIMPRDFEGQIFAIDGSNIRVCDWSVASLNKICAGYAVYKGREWQRTIITYDDIFLADKENYASQFERDLKSFFGLKNIALKEIDLDRLTTYFRELQEYIALKDAISSAHPGDLILYDGGFDIYEPLRSILKGIIREANEKGIDLLGVSKSSAISWGEGVSRPFVQHTSHAGSIFLPGMPWYISLKDKNVKPLPKWDGMTCIVRFEGRSGRAFRVDVPAYLTDHIGSTLGSLIGHSCSAECLGYPHSLFRAHRDIRIRHQEGSLLQLELMDMLSGMGLSDSQIRILMQDYHEVMEI